MLILIYSDFLKESLEALLDSQDYYWDKKSVEKGGRRFLELDILYIGWNKQEFFIYLNSIIL